MSMSGFEGFEKRLELNFSGDDPVIGVGFRQLDFLLLEKVLHAVQCTVVSAVGNKYFDSYVLSESSLFVYPTKIIIKTCGTTQLLKSVRPFVHLGSKLGLTVCGCRYTRGSFIFPKLQPFPHTSFEEEVMYLEENLPSHLCFRKNSVMPSITSDRSWHAFSACDESHVIVQDSPEMLFTIEVCMTDLDRVLARNFFRHPNDDKNGHATGKEMTKITGINNINPNAIICEFAFDPCGYSMNGIDGDRYSTIHVTPEDGYSYASFECVGSINDDIEEMLKKVVEVFRPATMSVSTTCSNREILMRIENGIESIGLTCQSCTMDEFPTSGNIAFQKFSTC